MTTSVGVKIGAANSVVAVEETGGAPRIQAVATRSLTSEPNMVHGVGDPIPVIEDDGSSVFPEVLYVEAVIDALRQAGTPSGPVSLIYPDSWSEFAVTSTARVLADLPDDLAGPGLPAATLVPESLATVATVPDAVGTQVVYDLGSSGLRVSVVATTPEPTVLGRPMHSADIGGDEFDHSLLTHLLTATGTVDALDPAHIDDPAIVEALGRLRTAGRHAREELSSATEATVEIRLPTVSTQARVVRAELEDLLRGPIVESVSLITGALAAVDLRVDDVDGVIVTGGAASTPLVAEVLAASLPVPVILVDQPLTQSAVGGALLAARTVPQESAPLAVVPAVAAPAAARELVPAPRGSESAADEPMSWRRRIVIGAAATCVAGVAAVALAASTGIVGGTGPTTAPPANAKTTTTSTSALHHNSTTKTTAGVTKQTAGTATTARTTRAPAGTRRTTAGVAPRTTTAAPRVTTRPQAPGTTAPPAGGNGGSGSGSGSDPTATQPPEETGQPPNQLPAVPNVGDTVCGVTQVLCR